MARTTKKTKVLFISQAITPYLEASDISKLSRKLPQGIQERGREIRTFMPRFGVINERRNQLHEVIRLSGMNMIINDTDHPLIIKVGSIQAARMQVYFIDNEEYFQRKFVFSDKKGKFFEDNDERAIFFARGVIETVKKLGWSPDIIHCHGWMTSLVPLYVKTAFKDDALFKNSKVIYSVYNDEFEGNFKEDFSKKTLMEGVTDAHVKEMKDSDYAGMVRLAVSKSDAVIQGSEEIDSDIVKFITKQGNQFLSYQDPDNYLDAYNEFYEEVLQGDPVLAD